MRVLLTTDTVGGVWTFTKELASGLLHGGHSVALVSVGNAPSRAQATWCLSTRAAFGRAFRYVSSTAPLEWMPANHTSYSMAAPLLQAIADDFAPNILHTNQYCFGCLPLSVPRVITAHSDVLSWSAACLQSKLEPPEWISQYRLLVQDGLDGADAVAAPTQWMLDALERNFRISGTKHVVLNGRTRDAGEREERRTLRAVSAGRLWDQAKGIHRFSEIRTPIPIVLAGERSQEGAAPSQFDGNVTLLGKLDESELLALFRASSIYLAASIYEPFGFAPLEAALCGCAVVANDIPSFREVWGEAAIYFNGAEALNEVLGKLHDSPALLERFRRRAMERASQLTRSRMVESYLTIYHNSLSRRLKTPAYESAAYA